MTTYNPQLQGGIGFEQPVEQPSLMGGIANLVSTGLSTLPSGNQGGGGGGFSQKDLYQQQLNSNFADGLMKAEALRAQGKEREANAMIRSVKTNYFKAGGDLGSADAKATIETITGQPAEDAGFSIEQNAYQNVISDPKFADSYLAARAMHPDASEKELVDFAIANIGIANANQAKLENLKFNWNTKEGQGAVISEIDRWVSSNLGGLETIAASGGNLDLETVQAARASFGAMKAQVLSYLPPGLSAEDRKPIMDYLDTQAQNLEYFETLASAENISGRDAANIARAISERQDITPSERLLLQSLVERPEVFAERGLITQGNLQQLLDSVNVTTEDNVAATDPAELQEGTGFTSEEIQKTEGKDPKVLMNSAEKLMETATASDIANKPDDWLKYTRGALVSLRGVAGNGQWATADGYKKVFKPSFFKVMDKLKTTDPTAYTAVRTKALDSINMSVGVLRDGIESRLSGSAVKFNRNSNSLEIDREAFMANKNISNYEKNEFLRLLDSKYGGNVEAMLNDKGSNIPAVSRIANDLNNTEITQRISAIKFLKGSLDRMSPVTQEEQNQGNTPSVSSQGTMNGLQPLVSLVDQHEGAGNYDTLFGHSQREGGAFAGVSITNMTIGELKDFANGQYGAWSKEQLGYKATPMGRYQFVGTTLASTAKAMGIPDTALFTPELQDAMFSYKVRERLKGKTSPGAKRSALRAEWEGFKNASDEELDAAIAAFENGSPIDFGGVSVATRETSPTTAPRPLERPEGLTVGSTGDQGVAPPTTEFRSAQRATESATEQPQETSVQGATQEQSSVVQNAQESFSQLSEQSQALLQALDINELTPEIIEYLKERGLL